MSEIIFRMWNGDKRRWELSQDLVCLHNENGKYYVNHAFNTHIMQYTGINDKNGKEIFVGDIINAEWINPNNGHTTFFDYTVKNICLNNSYWEIYNPEKTAKVIGNIYEK